MSRKSAILSEIASLMKKIEEYQKWIADLLKMSSIVKGKLDVFENGVCSKTKDYDLFCNGIWKGNEAKDADGQKSTCVRNVLTIANDTKILMDDIENVIKKLKRMIADCKDRISSLRSELSSLED